MVSDDWAMQIMCNKELLCYRYHVVNDQYKSISLYKLPNSIHL